MRVPIDTGLVNERLQLIVGQPLIQMWRGAGQAFDFGKDPSSGEILYHVKLLDQWRITLGVVVVMGSKDHVGKRRFYDRTTPPKDSPSRMGALSRWQAASHFLDLVDREELRVLAVHFSDSCCLAIHLTEGYVIAGMACGSESDHLYWHSRAGDGPSIFVVGQEMILNPGDEEEAL